MGEKIPEGLTVCWTAFHVCYFIYIIFLHQCLCSNPLLGFCEHCYMFYLESCAIGQIPKIVSFAGTEIRLFLNGIFGCHMVSLGPYFKVSNFLTVDTDLYHSLRLSL